MFELEAVGLELLVVERFQLVHGQLVELVKVRPPLVAGAQIVAQERLGDLDAHLRRDIEAAHRQHVAVVARDAAQARGNGFDDGRVYMRTLARRDVDAHARAAEDQRALVFALGDLRAHAQADAVEHVFRAVVLFVLDAQILDLPALGAQMRADGLFERVAREIRADDQLLVLDGLHIGIVDDLHGKTSCIA